MTKIQESTSDLLSLLRFIKSKTKYDFTGYNLNHIRRRLDPSLKYLKISSYLEFQDYLEQNPKELHLVLEKLMIHVTEFFRDETMWKVLEKKVFPILFDESTNSKKIRAWSAGCCSGEEIYTLGITILEYLKEKSSNYNIELFGTDIDEKALNKAIMGEFFDHDIKKISQSILKKYFIFSNGKYLINDRLRLLLNFRKHNLLTNKPIPAVDLVFFRNVSIYFNPETKLIFFESLLHSLKKNSFLVLGKCETLPVEFRPMFEVLDLKERIYKRISY